MGIEKYCEAKGYQLIDSKPGRGLVRLPAGAYEVIEASALVGEWYTSGWFRSISDAAYYFDYEKHLGDVIQSVCTESMLNHRLDQPLEDWDIIYKHHDAAH